MLDIDANLFHLIAIVHLLSLWRQERVKTDLKNVVLVGSEGELALDGLLLVVQDVILGVDDLELGVVAWHLRDLVVAFHQDVFVDLLFETLSDARRQVEHERLS